MSLAGPKRTFKAEGTKDSFGMLRRPASTETRLIIDVHPSKCCCCGGHEFAVLPDDVLDAPPPELVKLKIDGQRWCEWAHRFQREISSVSLSFCFQFFCLISFFGIPYAIYRNNKVQRTTARLILDLNNQLLKPRGLYAKTQKAVYHADKHHEEISWLAIALTESEALSLKQEEHVFNYNPCFGASMTANDGCCKCANVCCGVPQIV